MGIQLSNSHELMKQALDYRAIRQEMIASNIANADTPSYRPQDIRFEEILAQKQQEIFSKKNTSLQMVQTDKSHLGSEGNKKTVQSNIFFRDAYEARNDGNSVDLDIETTEMAKNSIMFNALTAALRKEALIFKSVINASAKLQ